MSAGISTDSLQCGGGNSFSAAALTLCLSYDTRPASTVVPGVESVADTTCVAFKLIII
jgi:hypothetical protein